MGELWGVFCEDLGENLLHHNGTAQYLTWCVHSFWTLSSPTPQAWINNTHAALNSNCFLAYDSLSSFCAFQDKLLIELTQNLMGTNTMVHSLGL